MSCLDCAHLTFAAFIFRQAHITLDGSKPAERTRRQPCDKEVEEDCDRTELCEVLSAASFEVKQLPYHSQALFQAV